MEERTFHLFSCLPPELREHIGLMAMRPKKPGVQTFRVYHSDLDNPGHSQDVTGISPAEWNLPPCLHRLALPLWTKYPEGVDGTSDHNISTYLIDASLSMACQESRSMMKRVFGTNETPGKNFVQSRTRYYFSGGATLYITIILQKDLIVLQFDDMINFNWDFLSGLFPNQRRFNLGIEYNQKWAIEPYEHDEDEDDDYSLAFHKLYQLAEESVYLDI
ncbi:hypothetical protein FOXB_02259 [Fusarium oxysporum f. sp. conglutinans Fo5176]|uniref:2EXR domain-containing protein n=2 Tax=Fusarium oxysporum TaxID=5507 RepID=F9F784_FUSOF|nr:hypothetical protein FOXB_02259 [Fusarium oxysporum f. sp. conglutinans Fo5176]